jgi:hypothetical protein
MMSGRERAWSSPDLCHRPYPSPSRHAHVIAPSGLPPPPFGQILCQCFLYLIYGLPPSVKGSIARDERVGQIKSCAFVGISAPLTLYPWTFFRPCYRLTLLSFARPRDVMRSWANR